MKDFKKKGEKEICPQCLGEGYCMVGLIGTMPDEHEIEKCNKCNGTGKVKNKPKEKICNHFLGAGNPELCPECNKPECSNCDDFGIRKYTGNGYCPECGRQVGGFSKPLGDKRGWEFLKELVADWNYLDLSEEKVIFTQKNFSHFIEQIEARHKREVATTKKDMVEECDKFFDQYTWDSSLPVKAWEKFKKKL